MTFQMYINRKQKFNLINILNFILSSKNNFNVFKKNIYQIF